MEVSYGDYNQNYNVKSYESQWINVFINTNIAGLKEDAIKGELRSSNFRSICWRIFLNILPSNSSEWLPAIEELRHKYNTIKMNHLHNPHGQESGPDNPLSQDDDSIWKQYFEDNELKKVIQQDVVRTFPEITLFQGEKIQKIMIDILFYYSREHSYLCYRQGMHEILAPLLFVLNFDQTALLLVSDHLSSVDGSIKNIFDPAYLEADAYFMFEKLMEYLKENYNYNDYFMSSLESLGTSKTTIPRTESEVVRKLFKIRDTLLLKYDPILYNHLVALNISFSTFGIRWLRLLFGGEFPFIDLLVIWDSIFAISSDNLPLINYIFVAMVIILRVDLLESDDTTNCLKYLMKYPGGDIMLVIGYALHLYNPMVYILPHKINFLKHDHGDKITKNIMTDKQLPERPSKFVSSTKKSHYSANELLEECRIKLIQYYNILNPVIPNNNEQREALNGMLELSKMISAQLGIIEMGRDVLQSASRDVLQSASHIQVLPTSQTPEEGPVLPPPATAITMKVFRKTENSTNSLIQGAPIKNPLKQMKR